MAISLCIVAQEDITKYYLENYGFDDYFDYTSGQTKTVAEEIKEVQGWTPDLSATYTIVGTYEFGFKGVYNTAKVPAQGYDGETGGGLAISTGWGNTFKFYQTITLPAGTYTIKVPTYNGSDKTTATSQLAWIPSSGTSVTSKVTSYPINQWTLDQITFTLTKTTKGKIQFGMKSAEGGSTNSAKLLVDYVQILATDMAVDKSALQTTLTSANGYYGDGTGNEAAALKLAIDAAQGVYDNDNVDMIAVLEANAALNAAILAYRNENVSEENPLDKTEYILNPSFEKDINNWDVEGLVSQTNTSFSKKAGSVYLEKWVSSGSAGDAYAKQIVKDLPNGKYKLTASAQNYSQSSTSKKNTGAYIYADDQQTIVYTPADYSVKFTNIAGEAEIGFIAQKATGNWLALDNFRLALIGYITPEETVAEVSRLVNEAKALQSNMMSNPAATALQQAIDAGDAITAESSEADVQAFGKAQKAAMKAAQSSIAEYQALENKIAEIEPKYDEGKEGAADLKAELDNAKDLLQDAEATSEELAAEIVALDKALLAFNLANATPGTGTAPKVSKTVTYVPTGATQALMRATTTGSNILERGVCWSTEHNPTVLDNRSTKSFTLNGTIFHITGMEPATVYYLRPYVMNKTYTVAYGDEVKIVTHPKGTCTWSWDEAGPDEATNKRCRTAIKETIDYFNEWTGIMGFHLQGHYVPGAGAGDGTADCSYGGYMRISQNQANQAIGTVLHETGHGVGVGTQERYSDKNLHDWWWFGRETNTAYQFLENKLGNSEYIFKGDGTHAWGGKEDAYSSFDWLVNGSSKDTHQELQYIGGMCILHGMFIDGLDPTSSGWWYTDHNGISGYTYNFDDAKKYYLMCKDTERGLGEGVLYQRSAASVGWKPCLTDEALSDSAAWYMEYNAKQGYYMFKNASTGRYLSHASGVTAKSLNTPTTNEYFQLMPDRTDVKLGTGKEAITTHGYWFTWTNSGFKAMSANAFNAKNGYGTLSSVTFDFSDDATKQQWIIISEDELDAYRAIAVETGIRTISVDESTPDGNKKVVGIYTTGGIQQETTKKGFNIVKYSDGSSETIYIQ